MSDDFRTFVLSVDDLEWTKHWLGNKRCDQLLLRFATRPDLSPQFHIRAVESKATSSSAEVVASDEKDPLAEAATQVEETIAALLEIMDPAAADFLVEDLRFATFVEHAAAVVLSQCHPLDAEDSKSRHILQVLSSVSTRELGIDEIAIDGMAVCTQYKVAVAQQRATVTRQIAGRDIDIELVRAGTDEMHAILGSISDDGGGPVTAPGSEDVSVRDGTDAEEAAEDAETPPIQEPGSAESEAAAVEGRDESTPLEETTTPAESAARTDDARSALEGATADGNGEGAEELAPEFTLARDLYLACMQRSFKVRLADPPDVVVGPSVTAISMSLQPGESLRPIEQALEDLAREIGVAANALVVRNHPSKRSHIQFLVPRTERDFPDLPSEPAPLARREDSSYCGLYVGRALDGSDHVSFVSNWPHLLVAGTTGAGKTTFLRSLLTQVGRMPEASIETVIIDGKGETDYFGVLDASHFSARFPEVLLGHESVVDVFDWLVDEEITSRRESHIARVKETGDRRSARELCTDALAEGEDPPMHPLVVFVDEFSQIMLSDPKSARAFERRVQQVAQTGRSMLVHVVLATQRPDANVVSGAIKANFPSRIALSLPTHHDSMTVLGGAGAERLLGRGDLLLREVGEAEDLRLQGYRA